MRLPCILIATAMMALMVAAPPRVAGQNQPALSAASSAELQRLLRIQEKESAVLFANRTAPRIPTNAFDRLFMWNEIALDTTAIDHTPVQPQEDRVFGEQYGPTRASRAMAIIHIAMFEAVNAVARRYESYTGLPTTVNPVSLDYAIAQSAHDTLIYLYPSQHERLDAIFTADVSQIHDTMARMDAGRILGIAAAQSIVELRKEDGSQIPDPSVGGAFTPMSGAGYWSPDPISGLTLYLGAYWGQVEPFTLETSDQFRAPPPPKLTDRAYTEAYQQVKRLGGDPSYGTPTDRTPIQTMEGIFWSYDGTPALCAPPRLYNQIARAMVLEHGLDTLPEAARMLAMINVAMADAAISAWEAKWHYQYWRPVTAIRSTQQNGNPELASDPDWRPLGAQATNTRGPNFTPPFPAYVSGHATIGGALFQILRHFYPDQTPFVFMSDEWNGINRDVDGKIRPVTALHFRSLREAESRNAESRIYLGVHWQFDADQGTMQGNRVGDWVWGHAFRPVSRAPVH